MFDHLQYAGEHADRIILRSGVDAVAHEAPRLERLLNSAGATDVTASWTWVAATALTPSVQEQPWLVAVEIDGQLAAAAVLVDDLGGGVLRTTLAGTADGHRGVLYARDDHSARALGSALADALIGDLREFTIGPVRPSPAVDALQARLLNPALVDKTEVPLVRFALGSPFGMSHGTLRTLRKSKNRLAADGVTSQVEVSNDRGAILSMLPLLEHISRERDHARGRRSPLDDSHGRRVWERRVRAIATDGRLQLATLRLDDDLAAYVLAADDCDSYRILEGRYVSLWARYAPGRLLEAELLERAAAHGGYQTLDWMTSIAPDSLLAANEVDQLLVLRGRT